MMKMSDMKAVNKEDKPTMKDNWIKVGDQEPPASTAEEIVPLLVYIPYRPAPDDSFGDKEYIGRGWWNPEAECWFVEGRTGTQDPNVTHFQIIEGPVC